MLILTIFFVSVFGQWHSGDDAPLVDDFVKPSGDSIQNNLFPSGESTPSFSKRGR